MSAEEYYDAYWARSGREDPLRPTRIKILRAALHESCASQVLDAGCGTGEVVGALRAFGFDASGFDISARAVEFARQRHPDAEFRAHSVEDLPWPAEPRSFDAVVSFEVIEHLLRPRRLLEGARRVLRQGGHIALTTPYHGLVKNIALALFAFDRHFAVEGDHVRFFTDQSLARLCSSSGFQIERVIHFGRVWPVSAGVFMWARAM